MAPCFGIFKVINNINPGILSSLRYVIVFFRIDVIFALCIGVCILSCILWYWSKKRPIVRAIAARKSTKSSKEIFGCDDSVIYISRITSHHTQ